MKRTKFTKIILGTCALVILVAAVIVFGFLNFRMGKSNKANRYYALKIKAENSTIPQNPERICSREGDLFASCMSCITQNYLFVMGSVNLIDLSQKQIRLILNFVPCGDLVGDFNSTNKMGRFFPIRAPVTMMFDHRRITFTPGEVMTSQNLTVSLGTGDVIQYPFDYFETNNILVSGTYFEPETNSTIKLPIEIGMEAALLSYRVSVPMMKQYGADLKNVALRVAVSRSLTTRFFSLIVNVIMWALSLLSLTLSTTLWLRDRKVEPPTLGLSISLLFALPTLRNSQPNIPAIGCLVDIVTLFWTVALAALSIHKGQETLDN
ncbi:hypothetical protein BC829DRAFT_115591 [Chytridium lagenaria]|nr:hypothetical protein BC829DRAFT_115591 [Chytridium lagenaria]